MAAAHLARKLGAAPQLLCLDRLGCPVVRLVALHLRQPELAPQAHLSREGLLRRRCVLLVAALGGPQRGFELFDGHMHLVELLLCRPLLERSRPRAALCHDALRLVLHQALPQPLIPHVGVALRDPQLILQVEGLLLLSREGCTALLQGLLEGSHGGFRLLATCHLVCPRGFERLRQLIAPRAGGSIILG